MKKNKTLIQTLCLPYCRYYKPGRNEELLCGGAVVLRRLIESGRNLSIEEKPRQDVGREVQELIIRQVCGFCEFREQDCDFSQDRKARPCGGYELISRLLLAGVIAIEDIR
jgi:hypothetical protein